MYLFNNVRKYLFIPKSRENLPFTNKKKQQTLVN